ncbi:methylthioribose-1-phosphate isomerase [Methylophilaceae bacterium]|nr:methylthioribose-1-phosphate isomerase [Methylophilaceae bacterium]
MNIDGQHYRTIWRDKAGESVRIIDQTRLPHRFEILSIDTLPEMVVAIRTMQVRGAPLIGAAAAYGMALAMSEDDSDAHLMHAASCLISSRPTAVNLGWAVNRMQSRLFSMPAGFRRQAAWDEAENVCDEDVKLNRAIGRHGLQLLRALAAGKNRPLNILTHCNAGWLATVDWGTAMAPVYAAHDAGIPVHIWVDETRPRNQGAHLTAWELGKHGVPHTVITDNAGGHLMQHGKVDMVIVGADRVTAAGDVCNKIGTYLKALAAFDNDVPFYAAVPSPTIDWTIESGHGNIPIEDRGPDEVASIQGRTENGGIASINILPHGTAASNPAFDVTPSRLITGIITERGICPPDELRALFRESMS